MKPSFLFYILLITIFSCKKDSPSVSSQSVTGTLKYIDPAVDGPGLYFETDSSEPLLFKNEFSDYDTQYLHYKEWVGVHARLTFIDNGETGCSLGMVPCPQQHPMRLVEVVKIEKE
ncbi:MAG TPA: hypothetical protein VK622_13320 [Puia sp.]|jgi:hypothetical protein|nr:hypothetical protein [Puia sp.]